MERQGIIAGIGDKATGKNLIYPQMDAVIYDYIISKNDIITGLDFVGLTLTSGVCLKDGYRGSIEQNITFEEIPKYIYGKFVLYFDNEKEDEFYIEAGDTFHQEFSITTAGTYYFLLYENGAIASNLKQYPYPLDAYYSVETKNVMSGAVIQDGVTTPTAPVDSHTSQPNRVANTEYVHAQIEREIDYDSEIISVSTTNIQGSIKIEKKARYVIGSEAILSGRASVSTGQIATIDNEKFYPPTTINGAIIISGVDTGPGTTNNYTRIYRIEITNKGQVNLLDAIIEVGNHSSITSAKIILGYQCQ